VCRNLSSKKRVDEKDKEKRREHLWELMKSYLSTGICLFVVVVVVVVVR
jgi:hypothetical protein